MFAQLKHLTWKASLLASVFSLLAFTVALAAPGDLDTTFSGDGKVTSFVVPANPGRIDIAFAIAVQANGKILAAGLSRVPATSAYDFALVRYNPGGALDTTFSGDGRLITNFGGIDQAFDLALQSNGKIVLAGQTCNNTFTICDVALARYNAGGALDTTFSGDGRQTTDFGGDDNGSLGGVAIQPDGKIVVAGHMWNGADYDVAVYRYLSNGNPDSAFSGDGMHRFGFGPGRQDFAYGLVLQSDGKIVVAGATGDANFENNNFAVARLNPNGSMDTTFSGDGRQLTNFGGNDEGDDVALQPDGKIVVVGIKSTATLSQFAVARYNTDGTPDSTFNSTGRKAFSIIAGVDSLAVDVQVQANGKIVIAGNTASSGTSVFALVRLNPGGAFDATFSGDGRLTIDFGADDFSHGLAIQPSNGRYLIGGTKDDGTQSDFALARVLP